jgi:hypothetical protein
MGCRQADRGRQRSWRASLLDDAFAVVLETENTYGKTFEILSGDTPIREAVEAL